MFRDNNAFRFEIVKNRQALLLELRSIDELGTHTDSISDWSIIVTRIGVQESIMTYPEQFIAPMRADLTRYGVEEARTPADVDRLLAPGSGTVLMVVNSICGCAAGKARPAIGLALQHAARPSKVATVFAGGDEAAVAHVRALLSDYPPSSPSAAIFDNGKPVFMLHRGEIERRDAAQIAKLLTDAFDRFCVPAHR